MSKKLPSLGALLLIFISVSCSKDPLEEVLNDTNTIEKPIDPSGGPEIPEPLAESEKTGNWVLQMQAANGLLTSSEQIDFVSLYDNALASIWFTSQGELENSERILDFFESKIETELLNNSGGFYQYRNANGDNGSRTWLGDNAWLLIAIHHYHQASGNLKYQYMADQLEAWLRSLQDEDGGLWGGFNEDGSQIPKVTEGIITAFNAVKGYDDFHKKILEFIHGERWLEDDEILVAYSESHEYQNALDLHSLGFLIFDGFPTASLHTAEMYLNSQESTLSGESISGYCFDRDRDVIWLEGTAQMAVAFQVGEHKPDADMLLTELEKTFINSTALTESKGIPYTANYGTTYGNDLLWDHADITPALSSTLWYLFAKTNFNPLEAGRDKNIPEADKFW